MTEASEDRLLRFADKFAPPPSIDLSVGFTQTACGNSRESELAFAEIYLSRAKSVMR
jgi:hypothetical protein